MKILFLTLLVSLLLLGAASIAQEHTPAVIHNTWTSGAPMPTARRGSAAGAIGSNNYVVDYNISSFLGVNEIYDSKKNTWTTRASDPNPRGFVAYAVVNKILYVFGGSNGSGVLNLTESYNPATNTWATLAPAPFANQTAVAVADKNVIYLIGGRNTGGFLTNVASYNVTTNTWTEETPLPGPLGWEAGGLLGTAVVVTDGRNSTGYLGASENYNAKTNAWSELTADPNPRIPGCYTAIKGELYVAGGQDAHSNSLTVSESYNPKTKSWTSLAPTPQGNGTGAASAPAGGRLDCFGGGLYAQNAFNYAQIYQP